MNIGAVSFLSGGNFVKGRLLRGLGLALAVCAVKRLRESAVKVVKRFGSVKLLMVALRVKGYQRLRGVRGLGCGVGAAALLFPYAYRRLLVDRCRAVKVSALGFTCNLADTLRIVPRFTGCPSGTLPVGTEIDPAHSALIDTPTPENFGSSLIYTPHRPRTNFHNSKGVTASVTQQEAN